MNLPKSCVFASILIAYSGASAEDGERLSQVWLDTGFVTYHFQRELHLNGRNPGIGVEYRFSESSAFTAGRFFNSDRQHSRYAGMSYQPWTVKGIKLGAVLGGFDGYPKVLHGGWFPALVPVATFEYQRVGFNVAFVPTYKSRLHGGISLQLKFMVWE
jgi:hypothetical protein